LFLATTNYKKLIINLVYKGKIKKKIEDGKIGVLFQLEVIIFGSVRFLSKKVTKPVLKKTKPNRNRFKPTSSGLA
jgi:hypothetical protein